jgi:glycosyltransferase involved in cell wall biosynthesis
MNELVTIYITNRNYKKYVEQAIKSVVYQTYNNIELIVIDDGSDDGSQDLLMTLQNQYNFKLFLQDGIGLNKTNNKAISYSNGNYIMRLDADDWLCPNCVEQLLKKIKDTNAALVFPDYFETDEQGKIIRHIERFDFEQPDILLNSPAHGACTLFLKKVLIDVGGYSENFNRQDGVDIWLKIIKKYPVSNIKSPLFYYRQHGNNLTTDKANLFKSRSEIFIENIKDEKKRKKIIAIVPVIGDMDDKKDLSLEEVNKKTLLEWKLTEIRKSKLLDKIYVTSSNPKVEEVLFNINFNDVEYISRPADLAVAHTTLVPTIKWCLEKSGFLTQDTIIVIATIDYPLARYFYCDLVCSNLIFFNLECVDTVFPEESIIYRPTEKGLSPLGNANIIKREREQIYKRSGGITAYKAECFKSKNFNFLNSKLGHVEIDYLSSIKISSLHEKKLLESFLKEE